MKSPAVSFRRVATSKSAPVLREWNRGVLHARSFLRARPCMRAKIATALKRLYNGDEAGLAIHDMDKRSRVLILVSKHGHCLNDLLFRQRSGLLNMDVAGVVSNHPDFRSWPPATTFRSIISRSRRKPAPSRRVAYWIWSHRRKATWSYWHGTCRS